MISDSVDNCFSEVAVLRLSNGVGKSGYRGMVRMEWIS
jgi:hypothetical protein